MRRGFKSWCERAAAEYREGLGVPMAAALDPRALAEHLNVRVVLPEDVPGVAPANLMRLRGTAGRASWSAVTISQDGVRLVILNSGTPRYATGEQSGPRARTHHPQSHVGRRSGVAGGVPVQEPLRQGAGRRGGLACGVFAGAAGGTAARVLAQARVRGASATFRRQSATRRLATAHDRRHTPDEASSREDTRPLEPAPMSGLTPPMAPSWSPDWPNTFNADGDGPAAELAAADLARRPGCDELAVHRRQRELNWNSDHDPQAVGPGATMTTPHRAVLGFSGLPVTSSNIEAASSSPTSASCIRQSMVSAGSLLSHRLSNEKAA